MQEDQQLNIFHQWMQSHRGLLFKVVNAYTREPEDRDDLFQEIAIQVWHSVPRFRGESAVSTWLYRIALNTAMTWTRREKKHADGRESVEDHPILHASPEPVDDRLNWLYEQIQQLGDIDKSLCLLLLDGYSYRDMSGLLGISESNVGVRIHRIKQHLIQQSKHLQHGI